MKKFKKVFAVLLLMLLIAAPVVTAATQPVTVEAAARTKTKLKKVKGKYYAYENGKKVCNKWRTIKVGKKKYRFYFDKKGRAYQANKAAMGKTARIMLKIRRKRYFPMKRSTFQRVSILLAFAVSFVVLFMIPPP